MLNSILNSKFNSNTIENLNYVELRNNTVSMTHLKNESGLQTARNEKSIGNQINKTNQNNIGNYPISHGKMDNNNTSSNKLFNTINFKITNEITSK